MEILQIIKGVLADPTNHVVILYALAVTFLFIALLFAFAGHRKKISAKNRGVAVGGNNSGVIFTGDIDGNVDASVNTSHNRSAAKEPSSMGPLPLLAAISAIISAIFAVLAYFLPPLGP
jgi:hypothetical protein